MQRHHVLIRTGNMAAKAYVNIQEGDTFLLATQGSSCLVHVGRVSPGSHSSRTCSRPRQCPGGLAEQGRNIARRVVSSYLCVCPTHRTFQGAGDRLLCDVSESLGTQVLHSILSPGDGKPRHPHLAMAARPPLCLPSNSIASSGTQENQGTASRRALGGSMVATQIVVLGDSTAVSGTPPPFSFPVLRHVTPGTHSASRTSQTPVDMVEFERTQLLSFGLSNEVISMVMASCQPSTIQIYRYTWKTFSRWCTTHDLDPLTVDVEAVLEFLQDGLRSGLCPATLRHQVAALDSIYSLQSLRDTVSLNRHPLVQKFLKGAREPHPGRRLRFPTWQLHTVLRALMGPPFEPMWEVDLKWVRLKAVFLVAITSARRVSKLGALSCCVELCVFYRDKVVLRTHPLFRPKVASQFHMHLEIVLPSFCPQPQHLQERKWHTLDVQQALKSYLHRIEAIRTTDSLFINISPPRLGDKMSSAAISRALRSCIKEAYIALNLLLLQGITLHFIRSAATSATFTNQASAGEICRAAAWSSLSTFIRHYRINVRDSSDASFGRRVLQQVIKDDGKSPPRV